MAAAWRWAHLPVHGWKKLHRWALSDLLCIGWPIVIPVDVWQAALPAFHAVLAKTAGGGENKWHARLRELVQQPQRTEWQPGRFDKRSAEQAADVRRVEVLSDITWEQLGEQAVPPYRDVEVRCRLVLQACPYLQHLQLYINSYHHVEPSHEDTFALLPHLRTLWLYQGDTERANELLIEEPPVDIERMLDSLPHLTFHSCKHIYLTISDLIDIASHSTLQKAHPRHWWEAAVGPRVDRR